MSNRFLRRGAFVAGLCATLIIGVSARGPAEPKITFTRDVAPIFYTRCVECHRPGEIAPMPLLTYDDARPWAKSIKEKVVGRAMPPWPADPQYGHFENDRRLSQKEIETIVAWVAAGSPKGEDKDLPPVPKFVEGWALGQPDAVISMPQEVSIPAAGEMSYMYISAPTNFKEDKWIQAAEIRPGNRKVVHHMIVSARDPVGDSEFGGGWPEGRGRGSMITGYSPGEQPKILPPGMAKLVKAGSILTFQAHYTPNGVATKDRSYIGLYFAKEPVQKTVLTGRATNGQFVIPAGNPNYEVESSWEAGEDIMIVDFRPHMHVRGKDFVFKAVYPDGRSEVVLSVPRYDFNWQMLYRPAKPILLPKGSRLDCVAHYDNSSNNKYNPDPTRDVWWGPQTSDEMMIGWFDYVRVAEQLNPPAGLRSGSR